MLLFYTLYFLQFQISTATGGKMPNGGFCPYLKRNSALHLASQRIHSLISMAHMCFALGTERFGAEISPKEVKWFRVEWT